MERLATTYNLFWEELRSALVAAEARTKKGLYMEAIERLMRIEGYPKGPGNGQTGYLNGEGIEAYAAIREYIAHLYDGAPIPFWLKSAEGK